VNNNLIGLYDSAILGMFSVKKNKTAIEYVRKDAFIEKTEKWLDEHILDYVYAKEWGQGVGVEGELFDDFKNYIKDE
jgi:hypothetical protein